MKHRALAHWREDLPASIVVFLVALPLCLGIALASNAPMFSGIIAGIIGGIVVGMVSGSSLGVSGPAAGLVAIVISSIEILGSWEAFLLAGMIAGMLQLLAGFCRGGLIAYYFPSSVIKGMLSGIGIIIILKQIPHLLGHDVTTILEPNGHFDVLEIKKALDYINPGVILISLLSLAIMVVWEKVLAKKHRLFDMIPAPLVVVLVGILLSELYESQYLPYALRSTELVQLPMFSGFNEFTTQLTHPDFSKLGNWVIYKTAIVIALIASIETLLCVEATDKLDPHKRVTSTDRELKAQGLGNMLSCLVGGLPITQVIVRSSANLTFGAKTKLSAIMHGVWLLLCAIFIPAILNKIPLASLAAVLAVIGYKLANPEIFKKMFRLGWEQYLPFLVTIVGMMVSDLLFGVMLGFAVAVFIILRHNYMNSHDILKIKADNEMQYHLCLAEQVSFLNKGSIIHELKNIPNNVTVIIDGSHSKIIDPDVREVIDNFLLSAKTRNIQVELTGV